MSEDNEEGGGGILDVAGNKVKIVLAICTAAVTLVVGVVKLHKELKGEKPEPKPANAIIVVNGSTAGSNGVVVVTVPAPQHDSATEAHDTTPANPGVNTIGVPQREGSGDARAAMNPAIGDSGKPSELEGKIIAATTSVARPEFGAGPPGNSASASPPLREPRLVRNEISIPRFESTEEVDYLVSDAKGEGTTRKIAISMALTEAVSKRLGSQVSDKAVLALKSISIDENGHTFDRADQEIRSRYESATAGLIKWWDIKAEETDGNTFKVEVIAVLASIKTKDLQQSTRKTLAVLPFQVDADVTLADRMIPGGLVGKQFRESVVTYLVNSRKFAVLDQTFIKEVDRLAGEQPTVDPIQRAIAVARQLGAQYAVIGIVNGFEIGRRHVANLDVPMVDGLASLRIIRVDNRQTVLASAFTLADLPNIDLGGAHPENSIADGLGRAMADRALETIYPFKVAALNGPDEVILNRGGDDLSVGQCFDVCNPGEEIKDPSTGESLGFAERSVASVKITRVSPKIACAKVISKNEEILVGAVCRKPQQSKQDSANQKGSAKTELDNLFK